MLRFVNGRKGILIGLLTGGLLMSSFPGNILRAEDSKKNWVSFEPDAETDDTVVSNLASRSSSPLSPAAQQSKDETHDRVSNVVSAASEVVSSGKSDESVSETPKIMSVTASALKDHDSGQDTPVEDSDIASMLSQVEATLDEKVLQKSSAAMHQGSPSLDVGGKTGAGGDQEIRGATLNAKVSEDILKNQHANPSSPAEAFSRAEASSSVDQTVAPMAPVQRGAAFSEDNSGGIAPQQEPDPSGNETSQLRRRDASPDEGIVKSEKEAFTDMKKPSFVLKAAPAIQPKAASMDNSEVPITPAIKKMVTSPRPSRPVPVYEVVEGEPLNLAKYLAEAEVYNIRDQIEIINGVWRDDGFSFSGEGEAATIKIKQLEFAGKSVSGIYVEPLANTIRRVRFLGVPSGNKLIFQYGIADEGFISNAKSTVYVKIWAGRHVLKRVRVLNEQGWKTEEIDMGVLSFLKEPIVLTFDISADDVTRRYFCFYAEIQ